MRYNILKGNKVHYVPGWDCHGLPIELKVTKNINQEIQPKDLRQKGKIFFFYIILETNLGTYLPTCKNQFADQYGHEHQIASVLFH